MTPTYRKDIDTLRALAVVAVALFHFGYCRNGYLGVDVFFVISGYLITKQLYHQSETKKLSLSQFYMRRIRRIIPLLFIVSLTALVIGYFIMLPDDYENLSESVVATVFFSNNILQYLTVGNYWNTSTHYMPLMHTWSLGIEEQFYIVYPFLFYLLKNRIRLLSITIIALTVISAALFFLSVNPVAAFFLLPSRFFELSLGGITAILLQKRTLPSALKVVLAVLLTVLLFANIFLPQKLLLFLVVFISAALVITTGQTKTNKFILENPLFTFIGKISFSIYMWHQVILAFTRYFVTDNYTPLQALCMGLLILFLSVVTYYFIEQPFRNLKKINNKAVLCTTGILGTFLTITGLYIYLHAGVVRDVPELGITKNNIQRNMHAQYNDSIYKLDKTFCSNNKIKVLVIGHSFARDWANVLLASKYSDKLDISYIFDLQKAKNAKQRIAEASIIYMSHLNKKEFTPLSTKYNIDINKVKIIGLKNFGTNNGLYFNRKHLPDYCSQRVRAKTAIINRNKTLANEWGNHYINILAAVEKDGTLPVFTPDCKFISQDGKHFTRFGAKYFAEIFEDSNALPFYKNTLQIKDQP
ncbi:acyltransferase family protein [Flavobacterium sp. RHBU_3]|uniref:acyltransferase family protein n=1 Tax=Flavobacterium sp. RHBU_3 TaxID=3391184 RepID=UPI0039856519